MLEQTFKTSAIVDSKTGQILIAHPSKEDAYVTPAHYAKILKGEIPETKCTYVETQVCEYWYNDPNSTTGQTCGRWATVRTCECED